jgi:hypothetical protein
MSNIPKEEIFKLFHVYVGMQALVDFIDELTLPSTKMEMFKLRRLLGEVKKEIHVTHRKNIAAMWDAEQSSEVMSIMFKSIEGISKELASCSTDEIAHYHELIIGLKNGKVTFVPDDLPNDVKNFDSEEN